MHYLTLTKESIVKRCVYACVLTFRRDLCGWRETCIDGERLV